VGARHRLASIVLLTSASIVVLATVGREGLRRETVVTTSEEELIEPECLPPPADAQDVSKFGNDACGPEACYVLFFSPYDFEPELEEIALEHRTLLDSLSPGARAIYLGGIRARADALQKERERAAAGHERDEAEYRAFIEARLRRLARR
jgi:hypothetical protein